MNLGTPQEMIDEEIEYYESIGEEKPDGLLGYLIYVVVIILIAYLIW